MPRLSEAELAEIEVMAAYVRNAAAGARKRGHFYVTFKLILADRLADQVERLIGQTRRQRAVLNALARTLADEENPALGEKSLVLPPKPG